MTADKLLTVDNTYACINCGTRLQRHVYQREGLTTLIRGRCPNTKWYNSLLKNPHTTHGEYDPGERPSPRSRPSLPPSRDRWPRG